MGVKIIRDATCDCCGKECSYISTRVVKEQEGITQKVFETNIYNYTELILKGFDSRFAEIGESTIVLCGECVDSLVKWLNNKAKGEIK